MKKIAMMNDIIEILLNETNIDIYSIYHVLNYNSNHRYQLSLVLKEMKTIYFKNNCYFSKEVNSKTHTIETDNINNVLKNVCLNCWPTFKYKNEEHHRLKQYLYWI